MPEVINLATFSLDTQAMVKNLDQLQSAYFDLRKEQKTYTDESKNTQKQIDALAKANLDLIKSEDDKSKEIAENIKQIEGLTAKQKELYKSEQNLGTQMSIVKKEINQTTTQLKAYQDAEGKTTSLVNLGNVALSRSIKNKNDARAANIALNNVANQLNPNIEEEAKLLVKLNAQMDKNTNFIKENSSETAKQKMNVGNYASVLDGLDGILSKFGMNTQSVRTVVSGFSSVVSSAGEGIKNVSNSIVGFNTSSKKQAEQLQQVTNITGGAAKANDGLAGTLKGATGGSDGLGKSFMTIGKIGIIAVITLIVAIFQKLYQTFAPIKDAVDGLIAGFKSLGDSIMSVVKFLSVGDFDKAGESLSEMGTNANNAANAAMNLNRSVRELEASTAKLAITTAMYAGKEKEFQIAFEDTTKSMDSRSQAMLGIISAQKGQLSASAALAKQEFSIEQQKLGIVLNGRKLTKQLLADDLEVAEQFNALQKKKASLYTAEQDIRVFNLQKNKKISDANVQIADDEFKIVTGNIKKQVELLDTKLNKEGITSKEISSILAKEQSLKMQALGEYDTLFKKVSGNKLGANDIFDEQGFVRIGINMFDMAKNFNLSANQADRLRDMLGEYKDIDDRLIGGKQKLNAALAKEDAARKKAEEDNINRLLANSQQEIDLFIAQQGFKKKSTEDEVKFNNALLAKETADLKLQLKNKKISQAEYEAQILALKNETLAKNAELVIANAQLEIDAQIQKNQTILDNDKYLSAEQLKIKQDALASNLQAETEYQKLLLENGKINQAEYNAAINQINEENRLANAALTEENKAAEQEKQLLDLENAKIAQEENFIAQAEIEKQQNAIKLQQELANAEKTGADTALIKAKYAQLEKDIDAQTNANKLNLASQTFGNLATIFGENSKAGKAAAIAQTTIDTYQSAVSAFKSLSGIPIVGPVLGGIAAAAAVATGFAAVKKITATKQPTFKKPSYASGVIGLRGAGTGTSDDVNANLSAGESIINAKSTSMFANELAAINQAGGGVGLNGASNVLNQNEIQNGANNSQMASMIAEAVAIGAEAGTSKGSQDGIKSLANDRKVMQDAKF